MFIYRKFFPMPPKRAAKPAPAGANSAADNSTNLAGCVIGMSGRFNDDGHPSHASLEKVIRSLGGDTSKGITKKTTHLVCTELDYIRGISSVILEGKVGQAKREGLPIASISWVQANEKKKTDVADHLWTVLRGKGTNGSANGAANGTGNKRDADAAAGSDEEEEEEDIKPKSKKAKKSDASAAKGKSSYVKQEEEEGEHEEVAEGQFIKKKGAVIPVDEVCPLATYEVYVDPETGMIYDASLNQSNAGANANKFYLLQVLVEAKTGTYKTWTRWGRVGEKGQNATLGNGDLKSAIKEFEKKFRNKSGLPWDRRTDEPLSGKYAFVERSYNPDSDDEEEDEPAGDNNAKVAAEDEDDQTPQCTLEEPVQELMELIFNQQFFRNTMSALNYDANKLPLGKLSKSTITRGFQILKDLLVVIDDPSTALINHQRAAPMVIGDLSNRYYSLIPHAFGRNRPPVIHDLPMVKKELELLESLSDMKEAEEIMKLSRKGNAKTKETVHPMDRHFQALGLNEMTPLDQKSNEFTVLQSYLEGSKGSTHNYSYKIQDIFRIERPGETDRFDESRFSKLPDSNKRLLWHGSRCTNFAGILSQGLRIAPPEAPVSGYMFGKGIYLADMSSKSAGYCASSISNGHALLLLCEAELGDPMYEPDGASYNAGEEAYKNGMVSTLGKGSMKPAKWMDAGAVHESLSGVQMPDMSVPVDGSTQDWKMLFYNEYICYDIAQVKLRYLFRVKM